MSSSTNVQNLFAHQHAVLPKDFQRHAFQDSLVSTQSEVGPALPVTSAPFVAAHPAFHQLIAHKPVVKVVATFEGSLAHEAGVYHEETDSVFFTSNLLRAGSGDPRVEVRQLHLSSRDVSLVTVEHVKTANGACPIGDHHMLMCDQGTSTSPSALVLVDMRDSSSTVVLNNFHGRPFSSLNDVIVLPPPPQAATSNPLKYQTPFDDLISYGSTIWFTDPPYGHEQGFKPTPQLPPHVYVFEPFSGALRVVADGFAHPNGIAFSLDGTICYVTDSSHIHGSGNLNPALPSTIYAFDVVWPQEDDLDVSLAGPSLHNRRVFAFADCGVPDGIKCDRIGNVYSGCGDGIHVWNRHGTLLGRIVLGLSDDNVGGGCANFCFVPEGRLVCFSEDRIYLVEGLQVEGDLVAKG